MSSSTTTVQTTTKHAEGERAVEPYRNPAYPQRDHYAERGRLVEVLRSCEKRLESAFQKLSVLANHADKARFVRLYHQMQGACDQIADAVRRMPLEVGGLYDEDHERFEQAVAAFERVAQRWEKAGG